MKNILHNWILSFAFICIACIQPVLSANYTVTNTGDNGGIDPPAGAGTGTLRQAIVDANNLTPGIADIIIFNILPGGLQTIRPLTQLPELTDAAGVLIDGFTQPGGAQSGATPPSTAILLIEIDGSQCFVTPPRNSAHGFIILSPNNTIRGLIINMFRQNGIYMKVLPTGVFNNLVYCNFIGTDPSGSLIRGNGWDLSQLWSGVCIGSLGNGTAHNNTVDGNLISGNYAEGVGIMSCPTDVDVFLNQVTNNYIGTNKSGMLSMGNIHDGVYIGEGAHHNDVIGNLISANGFEGVCIIGYPPNGWDSHSNTVSNNIIGLTKSLAPLGNSSDGVSIGIYGANQVPPYYYGGFSTRNKIGPNNRIANNGRNGVMVWEYPDGLNINADKNKITQNLISVNALLGIDLGDNFVTLNDFNDPDPGPNQELNFPVITSAVLSGGQTIISGTLNIDSNPANAVIEIYKILPPDPSGYGEGDTYIAQVIPAGSGMWTLTVPGVAPGSFISATATDVFNNTSEFSQAVAVQQPVSYDYGDCPDPMYPTLNASNGASHLVNPGVFLGALLDAEPDGLPSANASGDDNNQSDDEDGVVFLTPWIPGNPTGVLMNITASTAGMLNAWVDYNRDGDWTDIGEQIFTNVGLNPGLNAITQFIPPGIAIGPAYARFRFDLNGGLSFNGPAPDGEVEDYQVYIGVPTGEAQIDPDPSFSRVQNEISMALLPGTQPGIPTTLLAAYNDHPYPGGPGLGVSYSNDGGTTWNPLQLPYPPNPYGGGFFLDAFDPTATADFNGNLYVAHISTDYNWATGPASGLYVHKSSNGGMTWTGPVAVATDGPAVGSPDPNYRFNDRCQMTADNNPLSPFLNNLYIVEIKDRGWNSPSPWGDIYFSRSVDGGATWSPQAILNGSQSNMANMPVPAVAPDGTIYVSWLDYNVVTGGPGTIYLDKSTDGGLTWLANDILVTPIPIPPLNLNGGTDVLAKGAPVIHTSPNNSQEVYMVFAIRTLGSTQFDEAQIIFIKSTDGGVTWTPGILVNDDNTMNDQVLPWMDVKPNGTIDVVWYDRRNDPNDLIWDVYMANSTDGGNSFNPNIKVNTVSAPSPSTPSGLWMGEYPGLVADQTHAYMAYTIGAPDTGGDIYFNKVQNPGTDHDFGDAPLPYPTVLPSGATHFVNGNIFLGYSVDAEPDGLPHPNALGDDNNQNDDEDGVNFVSSFIPGTSVTIYVVASVPGILNAWIDYNKDTDWADAGEQIFSDASLTAGTNALTVNIPAGAIPGYTFARFRFSTQSGLSYSGPAPDGEVEDYKILIGEDVQGYLDFGDAPENGIAYPPLGILGSFPTCKTAGPAGWIEHYSSGAWLGPSADFETDGNAGLCPFFQNNFYDQDECSNDGDAGLITPTPFTFIGSSSSLAIVTCTGVMPVALGNACSYASWGGNVDIMVNNQITPPATCYFNLLMDWNQDGQWGGTSTCPGGAAMPEHVLVNFPIPPNYTGLLSALNPPQFLMGPNSGYVWTRFSITDLQVPVPWDGSGSFTDGESEDYLLEELPGPPIPDSLLVQNVTVLSGGNNCYEAINKITVAGNGTYCVVQSGGVIHFIASQRIFLLPGTAGQSGSHLHAYITQNGLYCSNPLKSPEVPDVVSVSDEFTGSLEKITSFRVYPNPTTGVLTLEPADDRQMSSTVIEVYDMLGAKILREVFSGQRKYEISLAMHPAGIYILHIISGKESGTVKIIKQ